VSGTRERRDSSGGSRWPAQRPGRRRTPLRGRGGRARGRICTSAARGQGRPVAGGGGRAHRGRVRGPAAPAAPAPGDEGPRASPLAIHSRQRSHRRARTARRRRRTRRTPAGRGRPSVTAKTIRPRGERGQRRDWTRPGGGRGKGRGGRVAQQDPAPRRSSSRNGTDRPPRSAGCAKHRAPAATGSGGAQRRHDTGRDHTRKDRGAHETWRNHGGGGCRKLSGARRTDERRASARRRVRRPKFGITAGKCSAAIGPHHSHR